MLAGLPAASPSSQLPVCPAARSVRPSTPCGPPRPAVLTSFSSWGLDCPSHQVSSGGCPSFRPDSASGKLLGEQPSWGPPALGSDCLPARLGPSPPRLSVPWPGGDPWAAELTARLTGGGAERWYEPSCLLCSSPVGPGSQSCQCPAPSFNPCIPCGGHVAPKGARIFLGGEKPWMLFVAFQRDTGSGGGYLLFLPAECDPCVPLGSPSPTPAHHRATGLDMGLRLGQSGAHQAPDHSDGRVT